MDQKIKWMSFLASILIISSACSLLTNGLNPINDVISEIDDLASQVPVDEIKEEIENLVTDLPEDIEALATDLPVDIETLITDLPDEIDDLGNLGDIGDIGDLITEGLGSDEIPSDIPVVEDPIENLFGSANVVSYLTPFDFDSVLAFYQTEMPNHGWLPKDNSVITDDAALLYFEKSDRKATVTLSYTPIDDKTAVMILIQEPD
jgi:hypothetical protein